MASIVADPTTSARLRISPGVATAVLLITIAFLIRWPSFGNPAFHMDEQFYITVGERMLEGALPYRDIWDRKPIGLFLLYAAIRLLGGDGVLQYQIVATIFAGVTATVVAAIARRITGVVGAGMAGIVYLTWLCVFGGGGGQSPVFYNLLVACAALTTLKARDARESASLARLGLLAMFLSGLAIQIKYPSLVEGCFFGLVLLGLVWARRQRPADVLLAAMAFVLCALLPTLLAIGFFYAVGAGKDFWFANFVSIFLRPSTPSDMAWPRLLLVAVVLTPLASAAGAAIVTKRITQTFERRFLFGWIVAAIVGFAMIGNYYDHYALPLIVPFAVAAAPIFDRRPMGLIIATLICALALRLTGYPNRSQTITTQKQVGALVEAIRPNLHRRCMLVFDGPPILYLLTGACLPTRYIFPEHLNFSFEEHSIGVDPALEIRRIVATRPGIIVTSDTPINESNYTTRRILNKALQRCYRLVKRQRLGSRDILVFMLRTRP